MTFARIARILLPVLAVSGGAASAANSLDGYLFSCGGRVNFAQGPPYYAFSGGDEVRCPNESATGSYACGSYNYDSGEGGGAVASLTLSLDDRIHQVVGTFRGQDLELVDGILVSFMTDNPMQVLPCTAQALDWRKLEKGPASVFFSCRPQNAIPGVSYEDNSFTLYNTGNAHFRSNLEITSGNGNTVRRDHHGVFAWDRGGAGSIRLYAGPQAGQPPKTLSGTLTAGGDLHIDGFTQENGLPCRAEGAVAALPSGGDLPVPIHFDGADGRGNGDPGNEDPGIDGPGNEDPGNSNDANGEGNDNGVTDNSFSDDNKVNEASSAAGLRLGSIWLFVVAWYAKS